MAKTPKSAKATATKAADRVKDTAAKAAVEIIETTNATTEAIADNIEMAVHNVTEGAEELVEDATELVTEFRGNIREFGKVLKTTSSKVSKGNRDLAMQVLDNAQVNTEISLDVMRETLMAETLKEAVTVQREAIRDAWGRNVEQVKDLGQLIRDNAKIAVEPTSQFMRALRGKTEKIAA